MTRRRRSIVESILAVGGGILIGVLAAVILRLKVGDFF